MPAKTMEPLKDSVRDDAERLTAAFFSSVLPLQTMRWR